MSKNAVSFIGCKETMKVRLYGAGGKSRWRFRKIEYKLTKHTDDISFREFQINVTGKNRKPVYKSNRIDKKGVSEVGWIRRSVHTSIQKGSEVSLSVKIRNNYTYKFVRV